MRVPSPALTVVLVLAALAVPVASGVLAEPAGAASTREACRQALNPDRRAVYRFKHGRRALAFARVVVTATRHDRHRYCVRMDFGRRTVRLFSSGTSYERRGGRWVNEGGRSGDRTPFPVGSHSLTLQVPDRLRIDRSFGIRYRGSVWNTKVISRRNP